MNRWIKKLHMYFGLLNFSILLVFGIAGLTATFEAAPDSRVPPSASVRLENYTAPAGMNDKEVADDVYRVLKPPLANPVPKFAIRRDADNNLAFAFFTVNGQQRVTVLERENRLRIEDLRVSAWRYFDRLHSTTTNARSVDRRIQLWGYYNEFAIWSLLGMPLSGLYLWLSSRPGYRPAQLVFLAGTTFFVVLYVVTR